jgi:hypothetical protein
MEPDIHVLKMVFTQNTVLWHKTYISFKMFNLYLEHFSSYQYFINNNEELSVSVKCEWLCKTRLHPNMI